MKNDTKILDKYFEEARNSQQLFPIDQARKILEDHIAGNASNSKNFWNKIKGKPMNIITTTAASVALIGILSLGIINFDKQSNNTETKRLSNDNTSQIVTSDETHTNSNNDIVLKDEKPDQITSDVIIVKEDKNEDDEKIEVKIPEHEKVNIKGINVIQLSKEELAELGIEIIKDDSKYLDKHPGKSKYGLAYCDNWLDAEPVRTVVMKDWGVVRNSNWETPDADRCVSPRIITDNKGNRRVEVFNDREDLTTKTYYNNYENVQKDDSGNEMKIKTNQTTTSYHYNNKDNSDIDEEITTELTIQTDDDYISHDPKVIVMSKNIEVEKNFSKNPNNSAIVIVNVDSANKYVKSTGDSNILRSVYVFDKQKMNDLDTKIKKFNFEWHEEQMEELKERIKEFDDQQMQNDDEIIKSRKIYKLFSDTISSQRMINKSDKIKMLRDINSEGQLQNFNRFQFFIDSNGNEVNKLDLDSLFDGKFISDSLIRRHIDIDLQELEGMNKRKHDENNMFFIKKLNNIERDINNYIRVNKMIPIEVPIVEDGDDFSFILWFDATPELLGKLPARVSDMIEIELDALQNTSDVCQTPIKGEEAILDIWRSCNGAIENLHVFPNPTTGEANLQFNLNEPREVKITLNDLFGRSIKGLSNFHRENEGIVKQSIDLSDLPAGMYLIAVESKNGEQAVQRIIVE